MGNFLIPAESLSQISAAVRDVCPFPDYTPNPLFANMLSINSSLHLRNHYTAVQSSLDPDQLQDFTRSLKRTFGREGKVSYGGVGVVALSLAVLFDTLARQAKGEWVTDSGPIPGLFYKDLRGYYPPHVYTISKYLRLVPHIANNPQRMRDETKRYMSRLRVDDESLANLTETNTISTAEDIPLLNWAMGNIFISELNIHLLRLENGTYDDLIRSNPTGPSDYIFSLNCDPETADRELRARVQRADNDTQEAFREYMTDEKPGPLQAAEMEFNRKVLSLGFQFAVFDDSKIKQREDFDLKVNALGKWEE